MKFKKIYGEIRHFVLEFFISRRDRSGKRIKTYKLMERQEIRLVRDKKIKYKKKSFRFVPFSTNIYEKPSTFCKGN